MSKTTVLIKQSIIANVLNTSNLTQMNIDCLYDLLLNTENVTKLKPFNMLRHIDDLTEQTGVFKLWLNVNARLDEQPDQYIAGKRVTRALQSIHRDYTNVLPEKLRSVNTLTMMFRLFFIPNDVIDNATCDVQCAATAVSSLLRAMILLDLIFSNETDINGTTPEYWLNHLLTEAQYNINGIAARIGC